MSRMRLHVHAEPVHQKTNDSWRSWNARAEASEHEQRSNHLSLYPADFWKGSGTRAFMPSAAPIQRIDAEAEASERYLDDLAVTAKLLDSGSTKPASTHRKPRGKKNVRS